MDVVKMLGVGCLTRLNYYNSLVGMMAVPAFSSLFICLLVLWGRFLFNRKLRQCGARCIRCSEFSLTMGRERAPLWKLLFKLHTFSSHAHYLCEKPLGHKMEEVLYQEVLTENTMAWKQRCLIRMAARDYDNKCLQMLFWILLLIYPSCSVQILRLFYCQEIGDTWVLRQDYSITCFDSVWTQYSLLGILGMCLYIGGIPALFFILLSFARNEGVAAHWKLLEKNSVSRSQWTRAAISDEAHMHRGVVMPEELQQQKALVCAFLRKRNMRYHKTQTRLGFIYISYSESAWWYEIWELLRKFLMNGVIVFVHSDNDTARVLVGFLICTQALALCVAAESYTRFSDNMVAVMAQSELCITLLLGLTLQAKMMVFSSDPKLEREIIAWLVVVTNAAMAIAAVCMFLVEIVSGYAAAKRKVFSAEYDGGDQSQSSLQQLLMEQEEHKVMLLNAKGAEEEANASRGLADIAGKLRKLEAEAEAELASMEFSVILRQRRLHPGQNLRPSMYDRKLRPWRPTKPEKLLPALKEEADWRRSREVELGDLSSDDMVPRKLRGKKKSLDDSWNMGTIEKAGKKTKHPIKKKGKAKAKHKESSTPKGMKAKHKESVKGGKKKKASGGESKRGKRKAKVTVRKKKR
jgi:hypothetical protein